MDRDADLGTLFQTVERLDNRSLDAFINRIISLRVQRTPCNDQ